MIKANIDEDALLIEAANIISLETDIWEASLMGVKFRLREKDGRELYKQLEKLYGPQDTPS